MQSLRDVSVGWSAPHNENGGVVIYLADKGEIEQHLYRFEEAESILNYLMSTADHEARSAIFLGDEHVPPVSLSFRKDSDELHLSMDEAMLLASKLRDLLKTQNALPA